jgi:predicted dinucleotide-binding enzyme
MKVGVLGSGDVAKTLSNAFAASGHTVRLGTRSPSRPELVAWSGEHGGKVALGSFRDVAAFGELLVLATKGTAVPEVVALAGPTNFAGKVLIDVTNPLVMSERAPPSLAVGPAGSAGEHLQGLLPHAKVVKAFNIVGNSLMFHPKLPGGPPDMFIAGNDAAAKRTVAQILGEFGWPAPVDIGGIEGARELEALCILWVKSAMAVQNFQVAFKLLRAPP